MKKVVCYLMSTVMFFSLFLVTPQGVRAEETAIAGVDTIEGIVGWSVSGETVTINNLNVNSGEFCIWSGDKDNAGYGKGTARLVIKGNCYIQTLVIDCPVEVLCEEGAQLVVGELVLGTEYGADGKLAYVGGTTYNAAKKIFEVPCTDKEKTEAIAKLPEPKKNEVIEDKTGNDYKVADPTKKEVTYKAPADKKAKTVTIPNKVEIDGVTYKVTKVDDGAFKGNKTVTTVKIPSSVTTIGKDAFNGCSKLKTVSVPKNVTTIGANAFKRCSSLTKVTLPSKATKIGANAFNGCKKMKTITIKSTKLTSKSIASGAFKGLSKKVTIKVPKKRLKAYKKLLKKKGFKGKVKA